MEKRPSKEAKLGRSKRDPSLDQDDRKVRIQGFRWKPNARLARRLPPGFDVPFWIYHSKRFRVIRPVAPLDMFLDRAIAGGLAILIDRWKLSQPEQQTYRVMSQLFHWGRSSRRVHARKITRLEDLELTRSEQHATSHRSVLPDDLTVERRGKTVPMQPSELIACGEAYVAERNISVRSFSRLLDYGLLSIALNSGDRLSLLTPENAGENTRFSLFGIDQGHPVHEPAIIEAVEGRLIEVFHRHLDDTSEKFSRWMGDLSTITRTIAKRKGEPTATPEQVRYILFDLLWRSHEYISQCLALQMDAIASSLTPKLTPEEQADAHRWYRPQPWLGNISPIALQGKLGLVLPVLGLLTDCPELGDTPWRACLQTLIWWQEIVTNRRAADLSKKKRGNMTVDVDT